MNLPTIHDLPTFADHLSPAEVTSEADAPRVRHTSYSFRCGLDRKAEADLRELKEMLSDERWTPSHSLLIRAALHLYARHLRAQSDPVSRLQQRRWVRSLLGRLPSA